MNPIFKYNVGDRVIINRPDGPLVGLITGTDSNPWTNTPLYSVAIDGVYGTTIYVESELSLPLPSGKKCECGSAHVPAYIGLHTDWCPLWMPRGAS